jgi:hypothetical protein
MRVDDVAGTILCRRAVVRPRMARSNASSAARARQLSLATS